MDWKKKVFIALDHDNQGEIITSSNQVARLVDHLPEVECYKIGSVLFTSDGRFVINFLKTKGKTIFLDLKWHDIPATVAGAARVATRMGVDFMNLHIVGGIDMMKKTMDAVHDEADKLGILTPKVLGVTVLTSLKAKDFHDIGIGLWQDNVEFTVRNLAEIARNEADLNGVVASAGEIATIRQATKDDNTIIVCPGIRPVWDLKDDQKRVATPEFALNNGPTYRGSEYIVVGRSITTKPDPAKAFASLMSEKLEE